jgi:hypothetical protein
MAYERTAHPHATAILEHRVHPATVREQHGEGVNAAVAVWITKHVGTMWCAYLFTLVALVSLPDVLDQAGFGIGFTLGSGTVLVVAWVAQTFLQLVLLSVIMVGQDVQSKAADKRAEDTYKDAEAVLHEALEIQAHLAEQDKALQALVAHSG